MDKEIITKELEKFNVTEAAIATIREKYMALTIKGIDDKDGYDACHKARMDVKNRRVSVQKTGKQLREDAVSFQRAVLSEEKRIIGLLEPIESHLQDEESRVDEEVERIKRAAAEAEQKATQERVNALFALGCRFDGTNYSYGELVAPHALIKVCSDEQFVTFVQAITEVIDKEKAAKAAEQAERKAESERLAKIAKEQEVERLRLAQEAKRIQDEAERQAKEAKERQDAILREKQAKEREVELEKARLEAADRAVKETTERIQRETEAKWAKERADAEEKARREEMVRIKAEKKAARLPDKKKLEQGTDHFFSTAFLSGELRTEDGHLAWEEIQEVLGEAEKRIREIIGVL